jgi:hypothetical protein
MNAAPCLFNWCAFSTRQVRVLIRCQQSRRNAPNMLKLGAIFIFWASKMKNLDHQGLGFAWRQVQRYGLTTANILYRRPDHPWLLQTYVWQNYDLCPDFPELQGLFGILAEIARITPNSAMSRSSQRSTTSRSCHCRGGGPNIPKASCGVSDGFLYAGPKSRSGPCSTPLN